MNQTSNTLTENKRKVVELIESFSKAMKSDMSKQEIMDFLHKVSYYTENFFFNEELFLKKYKIPSYQKHIEEHHQFVENMVHFQKRLENNEINISSELYEYIKNWYQFHILKDDSEIIEFIEKHK